MNPPSSHAHIITHTHWDREWFLSSIYTSQWIAGLIDKIEELSRNNPAFQFLLDGQTLVIEDLLQTAPAYCDRVRQLIEQGNLIIGPYYCQPDWQLTCGEALIRNLQYGREDVKRLGGTPSDTGWLVDTFGHIAQAPQIHQLFDIHSVFVWRGVSEMVPYFDWVGSDHQSVLAIDLFGGYRNLYGITHAPEVAVQRLVKTVDRLHPYYPTGDIPLFDGYDLEVSPEDPISFYMRHTAEIPDTLAVQASTPQKYAQVMREKLTDLPLIRGELNSGKYGATFPGTVSTRTYLKIMAHDCSHLVYQLCEPVATLAYLKGRAYNAAQYEAWSRMLLQNAVHDCICGVSIDQVHEKMEYTYRQVFDEAQVELRDTLQYLMRDFAPGIYAVNTTSYADCGWVFADDTGYYAETQGIGVWKITSTCSVEMPNTPVKTFQWENDHYTAELNPDGTLKIGKAVLGQLMVSADHGDTYSDERGAVFGICQMTAPPIIEKQSPYHCVVRYPCAWQNDEIRISAVVRLQFDQSPLVRWTVDLDSHGTDFQVDMVFETQQSGSIFAGMPFDTVQRSAEDRDLLPRELDPDLSQILLGQRELGANRTFPMHDYVGVSDETRMVLILAKGIYGYQAAENGQITVSLRRTMEWLTKTDLEHRIGDAGPFFYVPDARCERQVRHELAVAIGNFDERQRQQINTQFQQPPLIIETQTPGEQTEWGIFQANLPLSSLQVSGERVLARLWNPTDTSLALPRPLPATDIWGQTLETIEDIAPRSICTLHLDLTRSQPTADTTSPNFRWANGLTWRVGENHGEPGAHIIDELHILIADLETQINVLETELDQEPGNQRYHIQHQLYARQREWREYQLSVRLNELKLATGGELTKDYLFKPDPRVAEIGFELNRLRIKRRIYDYIVECI